MPSVLRVGAWCLMGCLVAAAPASAQLNKVFSNIFTEILDVRLQRSGSPGQHGTHFLESAFRANSELAPALNSLITGNVSSFPLSSTSSGILFDFSTGQPVRVTASLGPIFAETAKPLGRGKLVLEANYTFLSLNRFRGLPTDDLQFTFTHKDVTGEGTLGESANESDLINLAMDMHVNAGIGVLFATYGVTNDIDVSVAVPLISVTLKGTALASINSYTFARLGHANHLFGPDTLNPVLTTSVPYNSSATGIGDVALRLKYSLLSGEALDMALLLDARFPTGKEEDYLGAGKGSLRLWAILSGKAGDTTPHLNVGYARRVADRQSDAFEFRAGLDNKLVPSLTLALDVLGQIDLNSDEAIHLAPGTVTIVDRIAATGTTPAAQAVRILPLSNIPDRTNDNAFAASIGFRYAPSDPVMVFANVLIPLNDGGLRATVAPTIGISVMM
jgi:hypothetical protein